MSSLLLLLSIILLVEIKELRVETHRLRTHFKCTTIRIAKSVVWSLLIIWFCFLSSTESGLQSKLSSFANACNTAKMKISTTKTEVLHLSRNPDQCMLLVNGAKLKQVESSSISRLHSLVMEDKIKNWIPK